MDHPAPASRSSGKTVGRRRLRPRGLAVAQQLARAGHTVKVYERDDRVGGLLRYGIPEFKLEKRHLDRRIEQLRAEGVKFRTGVHVGVDVTAEALRRRHDALVITTGSTLARDLPRPAASSPASTRRWSTCRRPTACRRATPPARDPRRGQARRGGRRRRHGSGLRRHPHRQGAASVTQLEIMPRPADERPDVTPWPTWPLVYRTSSAHEEGGERLYSLSTEHFVSRRLGAGQRAAVVEVRMVDGRFEPVPGSNRELAADLVLLAMGFVGPQQEGLVEQLGWSSTAAATSRATTTT